MPDVTFTIEDDSDVQLWTVRVPAIQAQFIIVKEGRTFVAKDMPAGTHEYEFIIKGPVGSTATLRIKRPRFADKIDVLEVQQGGGTVRLSTFRVVNEAA